MILSKFVQRSLQANTRRLYQDPAGLGAYAGAYPSFSPHLVHRNRDGRPAVDDGMLAKQDYFTGGGG
jgi:hypothetical protein